MPTLDKVVYDKTFTMLKGEPGTRKSTVALSYPKPQYWFSTDRKMDSLIRPMKSWGIKGDDIHFDDYRDFMQIESKISQIKLNCPYKTVIFDSVTSLGDRVNMQTISFKSGAQNKQGGEKGLTIGGIPVGDLSDYKAEATAFTKVIDVCLYLREMYGTHVILIAHVIGDRKTDEVGITAHSRVIITGGKTIAGKIMSYCSEIYHLDIEKDPDATKPEHYRLFTSHTGEDLARTSLPFEQRSFIFDDKPVFDTWIKPAIDKLNQKP